MKELTLRIPDKKYKFFIELVQELGFEVINDEVISEQHKNIVRERILSSDEDDFIAWSDARKQIKYKTLE